MPRVSSNIVRLRIHERIRKRLSGTPVRPRLAVFRSNKHIYAQVIDDVKGTTLTAASSRDADAKKDLKNGSARIEEILSNPPEYVSTAKVFDMLMAVPKFGRVKAARFLNQCRISQSKTVGGLSDRQRTELIGLFNR